MKNKGLLAILIAVLIGGSWWGLQWWRSYSATVWKYLPENSFFVIQSTHLQDSVYRVRRASFNIREIPLLNIASQQIDLLKFLTYKNLKNEPAFAGRQITYAIQKTPSDRFTYLVYIPLEAFDNTDWLENPTSTQARVTSHLHNGQKVFDVSSRTSESLGSYTIYNNLLVLCSSGDVLEDWIRFAQSPLSATNRSRFEAIKQTNSELSLFIDSSMLSDALRQEAKAKKDAGLLYFLSMLPGLESFNFDKMFSNKHLTLVSKGKKVKLEGYINALDNQKGQTFRNGFCVPNNMAVMFRLAFDEPQKFISKLNKRLEEVTPDSINAARDELRTTIGSRLDSFTVNLGKELILFQLEPNNVLTKGQVLLQQTSRSAIESEGFIRRLSVLFNKNNEAPSVPFQGGRIYTLDWHELPAVLFGGLFKGFPKCYVAFNQNYIIYANDQQVLKDYLVDIEYKRTWAHSALSNAFLAQEMRPSNFLMLINARKSRDYIGSSYLNYLFNNLNYDLTEKLPFEHLLFQSGYRQSRAYSTLTFARTTKTTNAKALNKLFIQQEVATSQPVSGPFTVRNYPNGLDKVLVVNGSNKLINPSAEVKKQELAALDGPILGDIYSVDFLSIDRLQYVFATANSLYIVDEDDQQRYQTLPSVRLHNKHQIRSFQRLESGIESSFRFLIIDTEGFLYLWNSPSQPPTLLNASRPFAELLLPVSEVEYKGKRHFLFSQADGKIGLISELGVIPSPYKIDLKTRIQGPFFGIFLPEQGVTNILGSSKYGELHDLTIDGRVKSKTQLFRTGPASFFGAKADATNRDWVLIRESESQFAILDKKGTELFVVQGLIPNQNDVQYHFLGADLKFLSVKSGKFTTLYDSRGKQMGDKPIPSDVPIKVTLVEGYNKLLIYAYSNGKLQTWSLKVR